MTKKGIIIVFVLLFALSSCASNPPGSENDKTDSEIIMDTPITSETEEDDTEEMSTFDVKDPDTSSSSIEPIEPSQKGVTPDATYVGTWLSENSTYWANVTSVESDRITVNFGSARAFGLEAVALERDGKYYFSKELSPHFHWSPYSTVFRPYEDLINGYIEFFDDYFIVTAEKLFISTEGDVVTVRFLKQAENTYTSSSNVEPVE